MAPQYSKAQKQGSKGQVTFIHPDLGIGGAERLIVDAAVGLQQKGYKVSVITGYHDPKRAFPETVNGTLQVIRVGRLIPRSIFGRFVALCAYIKMIWAAVYLNFFSRLKTQVVVCDQVSACIPFLKFTLNPFVTLPRVLFYCHFPDQLLTERKSFLKSIYRKPLDWFEQFTTNLADLIVVNSEFTREIFRRTFTKIKTIPGILYPSINSRLFDNLLGQGDTANLDIPKCDHLFLSINRFEVKKNIGLVIRAMKKMKTCLDPNEWANVHLVLAGGYDERLPESVEYLAQLRKLVADEKLQDKVTFLLSPSDSAKVYLLSRCKALVYTPSNEHFGIVPLEAMYMGKPVIAVNNGGPQETVVHEVTGFLCPSINTHFGVAMAQLVKDGALAVRLGRAGKERFLKHFSFEAFSKNWVRAVESLQKKTN